VDAAQHLVFAAVVFARLAVPLFIPRFPLPAILLALVIDGVDQTIFQAADMTSVLANYQSYDKALDIYYLVIAYTSTLRNWPEPAAFRIGQVLWYWRLVGVLIFELSQWRPALLIFPNTFEYFFIAYEGVRTLWRPTRLTRRQLIIAAAAIWIFIKLPQEWWIHIAQLDATEQIAAHPVAATILFTALAVLIVAAVIWGRRNLPAPDWRFSLDVDAHQPKRKPNTRPEDRRTWLLTTVEKSALIAMIVVIFGHVLPTTASNAQLAVGVVVVTVLNAGVTEALEWLRLVPLRIFGRFGLMVLINSVIFQSILLLRDAVVVNRVTTSFFLLLLSLIITLYDHFRAIRYGSRTTAPGSDTTTAVAGAS
jgi:hypothetical protein